MNLNKTIEDPLLSGLISDSNFEAPALTKYGRVLNTYYMFRCCFKNVGSFENWMTFYTYYVLVWFFWAIAKKSESHFIMYFKGRSKAMSCRTSDWCCGFLMVC